MTAAAFWFGTVPWALTLGAILAGLYRLFTRPIDLEAAKQPSIGSAWGSVPLKWGLWLLAAGNLFGVLLPGWILGWNSAPARLYLLEGVRLALWLWLLVGLIVSLVRFANDPERPRVTVAEAVVTLGLLFATVSGILTTLVYRWATYWGAEIVAPYLRSLFSPDPRPELLDGLPWLAQAHVLSFFVVLFAFPFSRWMQLLAAPAASVRRFLEEVFVPKRDAPAGTWLSWGPAYVRGFIIVMYFIVFTVVVPSQVVNRLGDAPDFVRDAITGGAWLTFTAIGVVGLWWGQKRARV